MLCYFCDGHLGTNNVLQASTVGSHIVFSAERARVWIACEQCGRWNVPDLAHAEALLSECRLRFGSEPGATTMAGVGQTTIGKFRLTRVDSAASDSSLVFRHAQRIERRSKKNLLLGVGIAALSGLVIELGLQSVGGPSGTAVGVLASFATLFTFGRLQRFRRLQVRLPTGEEIILTRAHATQAALVSTGDEWALNLPTGAGTRVLTGPGALAALARILPLFGSVFTGETVLEAVRLVREADGMDALVRPMITRRPGAELAKRPRWSFLTAPWSIFALAPEQRLALEMIATDQHERDVLKLEVSELTLRLHEASEIATIIEEEFPL